MSIALYKNKTSLLKVALPYEPSCLIVGLLVGPSRVGRSVILSHKGNPMLLGSLVPNIYRAQKASCWSNSEGLFMKVNGQCCGNYTIEGWVREMNWSMTPRLSDKRSGWERFQTPSPTTLLPRPPPPLTLFPASRLVVAFNPLTHILFRVMRFRCNGSWWSEGENVSRRACVKCK